MTASEIGCSLRIISPTILIASVDLPAKTIIVEEEFAADQAISPENISIDPDTGGVAVADYDGNDVQIWTQDGAAWRRVCAIPLQQAHGIFLSERQTPPPSSRLQQFRREVEQ